MLTLIIVNRFLKIAAIILLISGIPVFSADDVIHLDVEKSENSVLYPNKLEEQKEFDELIKNDDKQDNIDAEFSIFEDLIDKDKDKDHPFKIEEESLFGKIYQKKLERTSIPSFLLQDELTKKI